MKPRFVIKNNIRKQLNSDGVKVSEDFLAELEEEVYRLVDKARGRAHANMRSTVLARDV